MKLRRSVALLIIGIIIAAVVLVVVRHSKQDRPAGIEAGAAAPEFEVTTLTGERFSLKDHQGKLVLLNFWASWCKPCVQEMPLLNEIHQSSDSQMETLFINVGESKGTVAEYLKEHQFSFPAAIDVTGRIASAYGVRALPATFILNEKGQLAKITLGEIRDFAELQRWLEDAKISN